MGSIVMFKLSSFCKISERLSCPRVRISPSEIVCTLWTDSDLSVGPYSAVTTTESKSYKEKIEESTFSADWLCACTFIIAKHPRKIQQLFVQKHIILKLKNDKWNYAAFPTTKPTQIVGPRIFWCLYFR